MAGVSAIPATVSLSVSYSTSFIINEPSAIRALLAGAPLLAGFGPRWQIIHASAEVNPVLPVLLVLGGLGVAIGYLQGLRATLTPERRLRNGQPARITFAEPPLLLVLISLLIVVSILLGLFPAVLIEPLQLLTLSVPVPIQ